MLMALGGEGFQGATGSDLVRCQESPTSGRKNQQKEKEGKEEGRREGGIEGREGKRCRGKSAVLIHIRLSGFWQFQCFL